MLFTFSYSSALPPECWKMYLAGEEREERREKRKERRTKREERREKREERREKRDER